MSTNAPTLTREQWRNVLDDTDRYDVSEARKSKPNLTVVWVRRGST